MDATPRALGGGSITSAPGCARDSSEPGRLRVWRSARLALCEGLLFVQGGLTECPSGYVRFLAPRSGIARCGLGNVDLRIATEDEPEAVSVRTYLTVAANATGTHDDDLLAEVERWVAIRRDATEGEQSEEELYLARHGGTLEEMKASPVYFLNASPNFTIKPAAETSSI